MIIGNSALILEMLNYRIIFSSNITMIKSSYIFLSFTEISSWSLLDLRKRLVESISTQSINVSKARRLAWILSWNASESIYFSRIRWASHFTFKWLDYIMFTPRNIHAFLHKIVTFEESVFHRRWGTLSPIRYRSPISVCILTEPWDWTPRLPRH